MAKRPSPQASFDFEPPPPPTEPEVELPPPDWHEVPAARFLSWSPAMQLMYCADRDENAARGAESPELAAWYYARAANYMQELVALTHE